MKYKIIKPNSNASINNSFSSNDLRKLILADNDMYMCYDSFPEASRFFLDKRCDTRNDTLSKAAVAILCRNPRRRNRQRYTATVLDVPVILPNKVFLPSGSDI